MPPAGIPKRPPDHKGGGFYRKASRRIVETKTTDRGAEARSWSARDREEEGESVDKNLEVPPCRTRHQLQEVLSMAYQSSVAVVNIKLVTS